MNKPTHWNTTKTLNRTADFIEMIVALMLIFVIIILLIELVFDFASHSMFSENFDFNQFLAKTFNLIIGIEFTRMLCRHTPNTIIEVLLFATARQLIVAHASVLDTFLGVLSIGILFALRKYLIADKCEEGGFLIYNLLRKKRTGAEPVQVQEQPAAASELE